MAIWNDTLLTNFSKIGIVVFPETYLWAKNTLPTNWTTLNQLVATWQQLNTTKISALVLRILVVCQIEWECMQKLCRPPTPPPPLGRGGHLDLLWFPITQMCVCIRPRPSVSVPDFVYVISPVFCQWLSNSQIWWPWTRPWTD